MAKETKAQAKTEKVMHEFKHGELHSGSKHGPVVTDRKQAIAIAMSESGQAKSHKMVHHSPEMMCVDCSKLRTDEEMPMVGETGKKKKA